MNYPKFVFGTLLLAFALVIGGAFLEKGGPEPPLVEQVPRETEEAISLPTNLHIPAIGVTAPVRGVGLTSAGAMDIPDAGYLAGWYQLGTWPGAEGSAVIAGHLQTYPAIPGVFWRLHEVQVGDTVEVESEDGRTTEFRVIRTERYPYDQAPLQEIFATGSGKYLNLITCAGDWNRDTFTERLVVYTERIDSPQNLSSKTLTNQD